MENVCKFFKGRGISKEDLSDTGNPCILYGELYTTYKTAIAKTIKSKTLLDLKSLVYSKSNDVLIPCSGETAEDISTSVCIPYDDVLIGGDLTIIRSQLNGAFLSNQINSVRKLDVAKIAQGKSIVHLQADELKKINISFPTIDEQLKIATFVDLLDQRIDTQSKIIEDLELFKNMISYKVLYDDKTVCYKPLSSFSELKNGYAFKSNTYSSKGDYQIVTIANVTGNRYIDLTSSNKILNIPNDIQSHQILKINDILISLTGNVGRVSYCNKLNCLLNQRVGLLSIKNKYLIEYIFQCIHNKIFEKTMISRGQGVAQLNIGKCDVESFEIPVYSQDRMNTISEVLKLIDFKIIKEKDILELYKKQKAYLLKNMFI